MMINTYERSKLGRVTGIDYKHRCIKVDTENPTCFTVGGVYPVNPRDEQDTMREEPLRLIGVDYAEKTLILERIPKGLAINDFIFGQGA